MGGYAKYVEKKTEQINTHLQNIIAMLIEDPHCFEGNPWRIQLHRLAIEHLKVKKELSKNIEDARPNRLDTLELRLRIESFDDAADDESAQLVAAGKVTKFVFVERGVENLRFIPDELKEKAFAIALIYLAKMFS